MLKLLFLSPFLQCVGWLSSSTAVPCQAQCFSLQSDGLMALEKSSVAAALSRAERMWIALLEAVYLNTQLRWMGS